MIKDCFLLTHSWRDNGGHFEITLFAQTPDGTPLVALIDSFRPMFFVERSAPADATRACAERKPLDLRAFDATPVDCCYFSTNTAARACATELRTRGIRAYETDVSPVDRFLMERLVKGSFVCEGDIRKNGAIHRVRNPRIRGCDAEIPVRALSLDIETNAHTDECHSIACTGHSDIVFIIGPGPSTEQWLVYCRDEKALLEAFIKHMRSDDPDFIIGWSITDFDLRVLQDRCSAQGVPFDIGRERGSRILPPRQPTDHHTARIPGRVVLDVPTMLRANFHTFEEYSLNFVAHEMLGKSKLIEEEGSAKIDEINRLFNDDKPALARYNLEDARLTREIFDKAEILPNTIQRCKRSGLLPDRTGGSVAAFDYLYLPALHRAGYVAGDVIDAPRPTAPLTGGYVMESQPGVYDNVLVLDFRSLYPSIIMTFKIDPLGLVSRAADRVQGPAGPSFARNETILPAIITELMEARGGAKRTKNPHLSQAIKILMNSFYGVLGAQGCRFFNQELALAITRTGQFILRETCAHIEATTGHKVIYGDTDSLFLLLGPGHEQTAAQTGAAIVTEVNAWLSSELKTRFDADSALELEFETHFRHFLMPTVRGSTQGSKKHYCGATEAPGGLKLSFTGMESVRSDWTDLAKEFQQELVMSIFLKKPVEEFIRATIDKVLQGKVDDKLIYKKRLRKTLDEYTGPTPPHVQAARLMAKPGHTIRYYITTQGPQPVQNLTAALDYNHYVEAQLRPIAETLIGWQGLNFERILSGQQNLFG